VFRRKEKTPNGWAPKGDYILVRPCIAAERTAGGLYLPEEARERPQKGVVLAVGPGLTSELGGQALTPQSQIGDLVVFGKYAGVDFDLDGEPVLLMRDQEALARKPQASFTLVEHVDPRGRKVQHEEGLTCEHCPRPNFEKERERLRAERQEIGEKVGDPVVYISGGPVEANRGEAASQLVGPDGRSPLA
jgi:chaperonin GroES